MAANLQEQYITDLIDTWGFGQVATDQLFEHADNVMTQRTQKTGDIVVKLGLASREEVEEALRSRPEGVKTLHHLRNTIKSLSTRIDEILSIQAGVPYLSRTVGGMSIHPSLLKDSNPKLRDEMNRNDVVPVMCGSNLIFLFSDFEKMMRFRGMGKSERLKSTIYLTFAPLVGERVDRVTFYTAVADNSVYLTYQQQLSDQGQAQHVQEDTLQTISQVEGAKNSNINQVVRILNEAISQEINDVALVADRNTGKGIVLFRRNQLLTDSGISLAPEEREAIVRLLMARSRANPSGGRLRHPVDGNLNFEGKFGQAFLRMSFIPLEESVFPVTSVSMRILPKTTKPISLATLNIDPEIQTELDYFAKRKHGLFVVCGPTGSGKSTTIGGMICSHYDEYGASMKRMSVEQPCERILPGVLHIDVSQHHYPGEAGDVDKFAMALRSILRHDPDLIFVGEVRDKESCMVSIDSANTGHLVLTTTHANDPVLGYRRMASFLDKERRFDLVNVLDGILAQRLIPVICQKCCVRHDIGEKEMHRLKHYTQSQGIDLSEIKLPSQHTSANKKGCNDCHNGYTGMVPVHGLLTMNPKVRELLLSQHEGDWMKAQQYSDSSVTLFKSAYKYFKDGLVDLDSVML